MNKMVLAIIPRDRTEVVLRALVAAGHTATCSDSHGGVLRQAQRMLFIAVSEAELEHVLGIIQKNCRTCLESNGPRTGQSDSTVAMPAHLGGAVIFVWDLDRFEIY